MAQDGFDVFLEYGKEGVLVAERLINSANQYLFNGALQYRASVAEQAGVFQPAYAAPDNGFLPTVVPVNSAEYLAAVAADNHLSKTVIAAEAALFPIFAGMNTASSDKFLLYLHENFTRDDGLVAVLYIVLRDNAGVLDALFCEKINSEYSDGFEPINLICRAT